MGIPLVGIADVHRWEDPPMQPWMPKEFFPHAIFPEARSVIVIGMSIHLPVLETSPSIWYRDLYTTVNTLLDQNTYRLTDFLNESGFSSVAIPRDGYGGIEALLKSPTAFFSHRHAAYLAGLGTFGVSNVLLTPQYGPRVRFSSVFTSAELPPDPLMIGELCTKCMQCVRMCPSHALTEGQYPSSLTNKQVCTNYTAALNRRSVSPCGICIKVCPVGNDRKHYMRENTSIYVDKSMYPTYHDAWDHVRSYGGR